MEQSIATIDLPKRTLSRLNFEGIFTVENCSSAKIENFSKLIQAPITKTGWELYLADSEAWNLSVNIPELNALLNNETAPGLILELVGLPGSGKTQLCFYLALSGVCFYICTNQSFSSARLREIIASSESYREKCDELLKQVYVVEISSNEELKSLIEFLEGWLLNNKIKLLIIDSITWPVKQIVEQKERNIFIHQIMQEIKRLGHLYQFTTVLTNEFTLGPNQEYTAALGDTFSHLTNNKILLSREIEGFSAQILKSATNVFHSTEKIKFKIK